MPVQRIVNLCPYRKGGLLLRQRHCPDYTSAHIRCDYYFNGACIHPDPSELFGYKLTHEEVNELVQKRINDSLKKGKENVEARKSKSKKKVPRVRKPNRKR